MDSQDNKLKITSRNQWNAAWSIPFFFVFYLLFIIWLILKDSETLLIQFMLIGSSCLIILGSLPVLYLHRQYLRENKGEEYKVLFDRIVCFKNGKRTEFLVHDIRQIVIRKSASADRGGIPILGIESYYCVDVYLKLEKYEGKPTIKRLNNPEFSMTCLLSPKVDEEIRKLKGVSIKRVKDGFNSIKSLRELS